jgi:ubiquinol-cytochrome c reductase cytochrome b subunit
LSTSTATRAPEQAKAAPAKSSGGFTGAAANYLEERTSISVAVKEFGRKIFPDHWSFLLGEVALYSFVIILLSGSFLTFFFQASMAEVHYDGSFVPLKNIEMSVAMASTLDISFDIRGGLLMRQVHHRGVPEASRAQLGDRLRPLHPGDGRGLHRVLAPRRPALR